MNNVAGRFTFTSGASARKDWAAAGLAHVTAAPTTKAATMNLRCNMGQSSRRQCATNVGEGGVATFG
jgi:hypothetical protein